MQPNRPRAFQLQKFWKTATMPWIWISTARRFWTVILFTAKYSIKRINTFLRQTISLQMLQLSPHALFPLTSRTAILISARVPDLKRSFPNTALQLKVMRPSIRRLKCSRAQKSAVPRPLHRSWTRRMPQVHPEI